MISSFSRYYLIHSMISSTIVPDSTVHVPVPAGKTINVLTISSPHHVSDASPLFAPISPLQGQSLLSASLGVTAADTSESGANISTILGTAIPFPHPIPGAGGTHILVPAPNSSAIPTVLPTSKDSTMITSLTRQGPHPRSQPMPVSPCLRRLPQS